MKRIIMRENRITIAKAIAIILMVMCHAGFGSVFHQGDAFINMFHMPLFFFVSGYCFKEKYLDDGRRYVENKIKGLYLPFVKWSLLFLVLHNVFFYLNIYSDVYGWNGIVSHLYGIKETLFCAAKIVIAMTETEQLLGGYWFIKELFIGAFVSFLVFKFVRNLYFGGGILLLLTIVLSFTDFEIPFFHVCSRSFLASFFIVMGRCYKLWTFKTDAWHHTMVFAILVAVGSIYFGTSMLGYDTLQIIPYSCCAIMGTIMVLNVSQAISQRNNLVTSSLLFIGDHTLEILTWHFLSFKLVSLLIVLVYGLPLAMISEFPVVSDYASSFWILYTIVGCGLPVGGVYLKEVIKSKYK